MKTFYEYLDERQTFHEGKIGNALKTAGLLGLGAAGATGLFNYGSGGGPEKARTAQVSARMDPAKELVNRLGSVIRTPDFTITSIRPHGNAISFEGHSEEENFPPMGKPEDILKHRIRDLISSEGKIENFKIENFKITITRKMENCLDKNDKSNAKTNIFVAANEFAISTGGKLEIKEDDNYNAIFYFINYGNGKKINYLSHGQVGGMAKADLKEKFGEDVRIIEKPSNSFEFRGTANVSN